MRIPPWDSVARQTAERGRAGKEEGPPALSSTRAAWEGTVHRVGVARRGIYPPSSWMPLVTKQGNYPALAPVPGDELVTGSLRHEQDLPPGKSCPDMAPDLEPTMA